MIHAGVQVQPPPVMTLVISDLFLLIASDSNKVVLYLLCGG
jgi:hypothetical protein